MNESYNQPFYVSYDKRSRFKGVSPEGYLLPIEPLSSEPDALPIEPLNISDKEASQSLNRLWKELLQLKGLTLHLQKKANEHIDKSKRKKGRDDKYTVE